MAKKYILKCKENPDGYELDGLLDQLCSELGARATKTILGKNTAISEMLYNNARICTLLQSASIIQKHNKSLCMAQIKVHIDPTHPLV